MRDYGKISTSIWNSRKFRSLENDDAKLAYFYLHTCAHVNSVGCFLLRDGYATEDLRWPAERYRKAMDILCKAGLIAFDKAEHMVRIVDYLRHDPFTNPKHAAGAAKIALNLPACSEKIIILKEVMQSKHVKDTAPIQAEIDRLSLGYRNPEPEPEPEPEPSVSSDEETGTTKVAPQVDPTKLLFDAGVALLGMAGVKEKNARAIVGKWRSAHGTEAVITALGKAQREGAIDPVAFVEGCFKTKAKSDAPKDGELRQRADGTWQSYDPFNGWITSHV